MISHIDQQIKKLEELYKEIKDSSDVSDTRKFINKSMALSEIETSIGCLKYAKMYLSPNDKKH